MDATSSDTSTTSEPPDAFVLPEIGSQPPAKLDALTPDLGVPADPPVVTMLPARSAPVRLPQGTKVVCIDEGASPTETCPVLRWGTYVYWPLSYEDNRIELDVVAFNPNGTYVKEIPARGTRYIRRIVVDLVRQVVEFTGQDEGVAGLSPSVTVSWEDLRVHAM